MATQTVLKAELSASARALSAGDGAGEADQLSFLPVVDRINTARLDEVHQNGAEERKRGRPKGSENLSSVQLRELVVRAGGHPVLAMARWAALTPEELAVRLGISKAEAFDRLVALWDKITPFVAPRLAPVDDKGKAVVPLAIIMGDAAQGGTDERRPWERAFITLDGESVTDQGLSEISAEALDAKSHVEKSHEV